jgi:uncharacterized protein (DUF488 family)
MEIFCSLCENSQNMPLSLWTLGHSTRPLDEFIGLLHAHQISLLVDVRIVPRSRYNPQFNRDTLAQSLPNTGLQYRHLPKLGGLRKPKIDSLNDGWRNASFRGYADYVQTDEFLKALEELMADSRLQPTAIMCAEAVPWRCHRSLIADALVARGWEVRHILSQVKAEEHRLTPFAVIDGDTLAYPQPADLLDPPRLF